MGKEYLNALEKVKLQESEKAKAKNLYHEVNQKKSRAKESSVRHLAAACLVLAVAAVAVIPLWKKTGKTGSGDDSFTVTAFAKELSETDRIFSEHYDSLIYTLEAEDREQYRSPSFICTFPVDIQGENIDTITYRIENGVFRIARPKKENFVVAGEKAEDVSFNANGGQFSSLDNVNSENYSFEMYKSYTVKYDCQRTENTYLDIMGRTDNWSDDRWEQFKEYARESSYLPPAISLDALRRNELKKAILTRDMYNMVTDDLGITCTVTYKDGSVETKEILIASEVVDDKKAATYFCVSAHKK